MSSNSYLPLHWPTIDRVASVLDIVELLINLLYLLDCGVAMANDAELIICHASLCQIKASLHPIAKKTMQIAQNNTGARCPNWEM